MDVVIPLGKGSLHNDLELRYCLRSLQKHLKDVQNVYIVGEKPSFLQHVRHIQVYDSSSREQKEANIFRKILAACQDKGVSEDFYFFNDDHFLMQAFTGDFYHSGPLHYHIEQMKVQQSYFKTLMNTYVVLKGWKNFDVHCPVIFNKEKFKSTVATCRWNITYGYAIKSLYCNMNEIPGHFIPDCKIKMNLSTAEIWQLIRKRPFFSIGDTALNDSMKEVLQELYPNPSVYEKN